MYIYIYICMYVYININIVEHSMKGINQTNHQTMIKIKN